MTQYNLSNITDIYWAVNDGFKSGRDPMGIQNSSIATYNCLLPGMTNLTGHIRYYSLYCWLLSEYDRLEQRGDISLHQYNFIRRAELILAFIMKDQGVRSIVGANFVQTRGDTIFNGDIYDIAIGADYENKGKYWTFKSGALGQYYIGSLIHYELVKIVEERFYLLDKGEELAQSVRDSVSMDTLNLMLKCVTEGQLPENKILELQSLGLHAIKESSSEWDMLNNLLVMQDTNGSSSRRESVYLMLVDYRDGINTSDFVEHRFQVYNGLDRYQDASFGWYFYYLCEALHYGIESIFCYILQSISALQNPPIAVLLDKITNDFSNIVGMELLHVTVEEWMHDCNIKIDEQLSKVKSQIKTQQYSDAFVEALKLFLALYREFKARKDAIMKFEKDHDLVRQRGILSEGLKDYVEKHLHSPVQIYPKEMVKQIMNEHTFVALSKMGKHELDLRKFILENGCAILVEIRYPIETNPRIESLHNFLVDLRYLNENEHLTPIAQQFILNYGRK